MSYREIPPDPCLHRTYGVARIGSLAEELNISQRHLERQFAQQIGVNAKTLAHLTGEFRALAHTTSASFAQYTRKGTRTTTLTHSWRSSGWKPCPNSAEQADPPQNTDVNE